MNSNTFDEFSWKETQPHVYERKLDFMELLHHQVGSIYTKLNGEQWCVTVRIKLHTVISDQELVQKVKLAWMNARFKHPEIASIVKEDRRLYEVTGDWEPWIANTFTVFTDRSADDEFPHLPRPHGQQTRLYLFLQTKEILIRSSHDRIDARGAIFLLDDLVRFIAIPEFEQIPFGGETVNFSPPIEVSGCLPQTTEDDSKKAIEFLLKGVVGVLSTGLKGRDLGTPPTVTKRFDFRLSTEETTQVVKAVKEKGFTVTHAIHAALVLTSKLMGTTDRSFYSSIAVFDLRAICPEELRRQTAAYHSIWPVNVTVDGFQTTMEGFKDFYLSFPGRKLETARTGIYRPMVAAIRDAISVPPPAPNTSVGLSSLGIIDELMTWEHEGVKASDFWLAQDISSPNVICTTWTQAGYLYIDATYNDKYYTREEVEAFLARTKTVLFHGLGIRRDDSLVSVI